MAVLAFGALAFGEDAPTGATTGNEATKTKTDSTATDTAKGDAVKASPKTAKKGKHSKKKAATEDKTM